MNQILLFSGGFSFLPENSFRSRTRSSKSSVAMSMVLMKAKHVVMYGTTSAFFNSLMIKLNLYLCPLVSCEKKH